MAEQGKSDERWIVTDREDGRNVNSWHWEEKQRLPWAKETLGDLLLVRATAAGGGGSGGGNGVAPPAPQKEARITEVRSVEGEAMTTTRKGGRRFPVYDLRVTCAWSVGGAGGGGAGEAGGEGGEAEGGGGKEGGGGEEGEGAAEGKSARTGTVVIEELASTHEPDDYVVTFKADGSAGEDAAARDEAQRLLRGPLLAALAAFCDEIAKL